MDGERLAHEVMQQDPPQDHPNYWDAVSSTSVENPSLAKKNVVMVFFFD